MAKERESGGTPGGDTARKIKERKEKEINQNKQ